MMTQQQPCRQRNRLLFLSSWILVGITLLIVVDGFTVVVQQQQQHKSILCLPKKQQQQHTQHLRLEMTSESTNKEQESEQKEETIVDEEKDDADDDEQEEEDEEVEEEEEEESEEEKEMKQLKEEITKLESNLKNKRQTLSYYNDMADDYTKTGYARKVAEMENMRRARSMLASSNKFSATASTLTEFLPIMDELDVLRTKYSDDEFGKQYNAVTGAMKTALNALDVVEYKITVGEPIDNNRMIIVESKYSNEYPKNTVLEVLSNGMELKGNTIRSAQCVASLGVEEVKKEEKEEVEETTTDNNEQQENKEVSKPGEETASATEEK